MPTIEEEYRNSDDDWFGLAAAQDRKDFESLRAYLQHHVKLIPPEHVIVQIMLIMSSSHLPKGAQAPCLVANHFDPGDAPDPQRMFMDRTDDGTIDLKQTVIQCGYDVFKAFSDFTISLTARGYYADAPDETRHSHRLD